ncbi:MAG: hypothetical protein RIQ99_813 [Pseudomonadota bacterium]
MAQVKANGITLEVERYGDPAAPALLLIMGLGAQLTLWPMELVDALVGHGYHVIRYDNRDIGLSTKFDTEPVPEIPAVIAALMNGQTPQVPYTLTDMADDAAALLDALGIASAHVVGGSMGGMIAQLVAANHPDKVLTLTSIFSSTGNPALPPARPEAMAALLGRPANADLETLIDFGVQTARAIGSPAYPAPEADLRARIARDIQRSFYPQGLARQFAAIVADGDRRARLQAITAPTLVIHGEDDPLVPVDGGQDTAANIAGARLHTIPGMGHDLPTELTAQIAAAIAAHAR